MNNWRPLALVLLCSASQHSLANIVDQVSHPTVQGASASAFMLGKQATELTLADAVYLGLRSNREIRSAYLQRVAQKFDLRVSEDTFKPKLTLSANYTSAKGSSDRKQTATMGPTTDWLSEYGTRTTLGWKQEQGTGLGSGRYRSDGLDLAIIQPLLRGAGREVTTAPVRLAQLNEQANRLNLKSSVSSTISEIISTYRQLLRSQEQLTIARQALERARQLLAVNNALIDAGRMAAFDAVQTEADIASQELQVEEAQNQLDTDRLSLLRLLALDLSTPIHASETLQVSRINIDKIDALRLARAQQPRYLATLLGSQQADLNLVVAKDQARWDVSLVAGANQVRDRFERTSTSARSWERYAGVHLQIPVGDLASRQSRVNAQVGVETQALLLEDAHQALERDVNDVVRDLGTRWRQYEIAQRSHELATRKLAIEHEKLNVGRSSNFQVLSYESDLRNSENALLNARIAYLNAQTQLDQVLGMTLESWDIALNDY